MTAPSTPRPAASASRAHHLGFVGVEPAAEGDDVDRHQAAPCGIARPGAASPDRSCRRIPTRPGRSSGRGRRRAIRSRGRRRAAVTVTCASGAAACARRRRRRRRRPSRRRGSGRRRAPRCAWSMRVAAPSHGRARCWRARERSDGFRAAGRSGRDRRPRRPSTQKIACGLPMMTTEGECSTGASIGPICSSIVRVSRNSSASGISCQPKRGAPMSTEISAVGVLLGIEDAGDGLEGEELAGRSRRPAPARRSACRCRRPAPSSRRN